MNHMKILIGFQTAKGPVYVGQTPDKRFHPVWKGQTLGSYHSIAAALDDVAGGHTFSTPDGTDLSALHISADIGDWQPVGELA